MSTMANGGDFFIESKGHCFLCLNQTLVKDFGPEADLASPSPGKYSLQCLSKYLKMDMRKVFHEWEQVPPNLLSKVEESNLKAELCVECASLIQKFSLVNRQLEKIEMEMVSAVNLIQTKLSEAQRKDKFAKLRELHNSSDALGDRWTEKLNILEVLRDEAICKCTRMLSRTSPRVKVRMLTKRKIIQAKLRLKTRSVKTLLGSQQNSDLNKRQKTAEETCYIKQEGVGEGLVADVNEPMTTDMDWSVDDEDSTNSAKPLTSHEAKSRFSAPVNSLSKIDKNSYCEITSSLTRQFKCTQCEKTFTQRDACKLHFKSVHLAIRQKCEECNKTFAYASNVRTHRRRTGCGTKVRPKPKQNEKYVCHCRHCGNGFTLRSTLLKHIREVHLKLLRHVCEICGKRFNRRFNLNNHRRQLHHLTGENKNINLLD